MMFPGALGVDGAVVAAFLDTEEDFVYATMSWKENSDDLSHSTTLLWTYSARDRFNIEWPEGA